MTTTLFSPYPQALTLNTLFHHLPLTICIMSYGKSLKITLLPASMDGGHMNLRTYLIVYYLHFLIFFIFAKKLVVFLHPSIIHTPPLFLREWHVLHSVYGPSPCFRFPIDST